MGVPVASWTDAQKLGEAMKRSEKYMPASLAAQVDALVSPENLSIMAATIALWAGSHLFGVGEIVDVGLLLVGAFCIGWSIDDVMRDLWTFGTTAIRARSDDDLDRAGQAFARAVITAGITAVMAILLRRSAQEISVRGGSWVDAGRPKNPGLEPVGSDPQAGKLWRTPTVTGDPTIPVEEGKTSAFGDVRYSTQGTATQQQIARIHELGHSWLSPRFRVLRRFRARVGMSAYVRSALMQYLEEAIVETNAQLQTYGLSGLWRGITFPIRYGYVKLEVTPIGKAVVLEGVNLGTIAVGTQRFVVEFIQGKPAGEPGQRRRR
jgi:hypothetical protein